VKNNSVLISGASIAGPALAYWLNEYGFEVTLVEKAAEVRPGGQAVDFKGDTHRTVLAKMDILDAVREAQVPATDETLVDASGRKVGRIPKEFSGGEINVPRGDIARILYDRTSATCEYVFDDSISQLVQSDDGVHVDFKRSASRRFDLVVGADGIHSNVRAMAFGPEPEYVRHLGYYYALAHIDVDDEDLMYNEPGRMAATGGIKAPAFFVFASAPLEYDRDDIAQQKQLVIDAYQGGAWKIPDLIARLPAAREFYFDSISRVTTDHYAKGRVALVGDSAYANALGGFGTGLALVGAYVLAGELYRAKGDHRTAYAEYEAKFRNYAKISQNVNSGRLLAPPTKAAIRLRNLMFSVAPLFTPLMKISDRFATNIKLEDYGD
jgi:2-polyprenyl-6-methoxyphenol hydroxylase-like FAD-dependent oxidoreductase